MAASLSTRTVFCAQAGFEAARQIEALTELSELAEFTLEQQGEQHA